MSAVSIKRVRCDLLPLTKKISLTRGITETNSTFFLHQMEGLHRCGKKIKAHLANKLRFAVESKRAKAKRKICLRLTC